MVMSVQLPPSLDKEVHDLPDEVKFARSLTPEQRLEILAKACSTTQKLLRLNKQGAQLLKRKEALPASTIAAFRRLKKEQGRGN